MPAHAIAPSPVARLLLELEARSASGGVDVGGRRLVFNKGSIVEVRPASDDASLGDFLVAAGRLNETDLSAAKKQATEQRTALEVVLRNKDLVPLDVLLETRRALWLDRFVRGLSSEEKLGKQPGLLTPEPHRSAGPAIATLPFVLDGLARRAGFGDAEQVGRAATAWFDFLDTPQRERACAWSDFGEVREAMPASGLFARHPAAPSRIAALVRAGLARLSEERPALPHPAPRNPVIAAPAPRSLDAPARAGSIAPPKLAPAQRLEPGGSACERGPIGIEPIASWFPKARGTLDDPLDALERRIASLEQSGASPAERARAWLDLARAFRTYHDSVDEAARASREAAAADPKSHEALEAAAVLCSAVGRPDLAYAYALAWADVTSDPAQRARVLLRAAEYAQRADKDASALRCLRLAYDAVPDDPQLGERLARALGARGDVPSAVRIARLAAERYRKLRPEGARALLSWATQIAPDDAELASDYASTLAADGFGEAAVSVIARAARKSGDSPARSKLWLHAAVRAELSARPDVAGDLLLEAFDSEPGDASPYYEPLIHDLAAAGAGVEVALLCAEIAARCSGPEQSVWLTRAGEARLELPGDPTHALQLFTEALVADPSNQRAADVIAQFADSERDPSLLSDALERALSSSRTNKGNLLALLDRFLVQVTTVQRAPLLERWAWAFSARLGGRGPSEAEQKAMETRLGLFENEIRTLEHTLRTVPAEERADVAIRLAERMRDDPMRRPKARKLLEKVLEIDSAHPVARRLLAALLRLEGDTRSLCVLESQRVLTASSSFERVAAELSWIHAELAAGNPRGAIEACLALLSHAPKNREGVLLLWRLSLREGDDALVRDALVRRVEASLDPRERARALMAVARSCLSASDRIEAEQRADAALAADPRSADAALMLLELQNEQGSAQRVAVLKTARAVLGDTPELVAKLARACFGTRDPKGQLEALEVHARLSPFDTFAVVGLAALWATGSDVESITLSVRRLLLAPERMLHPSAARAALAGLERLWALGQRRDAIELALEASSSCGELADELLSWGIACVRELHDPRLELALTERAIARASDDERRELLQKLASQYRELGVRHAEARAYLRLLALEPTDATALERLAFIYAETRESERLMSVLTLALDLADTQEERRDRLLSLALASVDLSGNPEGAQELVASALLSELDGEGAIIDAPLDVVQRGVGLLLGSRSPQTAFDLVLELSETSSRERALLLLDEAVYIAERHLQNLDLALRAATLGLESQPGHPAFLLHFERLALDLGDVATGLEVYRHLAESSMGLHGRRAVLYRAARWLERVGALSEALSMAEQAFALDPSEGAVLRTLERLSLATGQFGGLVRALRLLADEAPRSARRSELLLRAATISEDDLRDPERAFALYELAFRASPNAEIEARALGCARRFADADPDAARLALQRWRDMLVEQVREAWATPVRVRALVSLGKLSLDAFGLEREAARYAGEAEAALDEDEDLDGESRVSLLAELSSLSGRLSLQADAKGRSGDQRASEARMDLPTAPRPPRPGNGTTGASSTLVEAAGASAQQAPVRVEPRAPEMPGQMAVAAAGSRTVSAIPYGSPMAASEPFGRARITASMGGLPRTGPRTTTNPNFTAPSAPEPGHATSVEPPAIPRGEPSNSVDDLARAPHEQRAVKVVEGSDQLVRALSRGDERTAGELLERVARDRAKADAACEHLLRATRQAGPTLLTLRGLARLASSVERPGLAATCGEVLSLADPNRAARDAHPELDPASASAKAALLDARDDGDLSPAFTMLAHVYQGAGPLFRRNLTSYGVGAGDFISPRDGSAYGQALKYSCSLFGVEHETYLQHSQEDRIGMIPTHPPALLVGDKTSEDPALLRFRMARAFERARPGSMLLATLAAESAEVLLLAIRAAFGPTDRRSPPVAREAASLAAELWRTMPSSAQRQVSNLFRVLKESPSLGRLMEQLALRTARVGLIAVTALDVALLALPYDLAGNNATLEHSERGLDRALHEDPVFRGLVTFALSDSYLTLREELGA